MPVYIYQPNALELMTQVEGPRWGKLQVERQDNEGFYAFKRAWEYIREVAPDWTDHIDPNLLPGVRQSECTIYGEGGWSRYVVTAKGEIVLLGGTTHDEKCRKAKALGFRVT